MAKKVIMQYRICDRCSGENEAVVTERIGFNGETYSLDLCQKHSNELNSDFHAWAEHGTQTGKASRFDARKVHNGPTYVDLSFTPSAPTEIHAEPAPVARRTLPEHPMTAERWTLTHHALERMRTRDIRHAQALHAAQAPEVVSPSKLDPDLERRTRGDVVVIVNPHEEIILTVYRPDEREDDLALSTRPTSRVATGAR